MDLLGSLRHSEQDSEESELVNESVKNKLRNFVNDEKESPESDTEKSFELPLILFRRPTTKSEVRKSYVERMVNNYLRKKIVPESSSSNNDISKVASAQLPIKRMHPSSTPFYMNNARVSVEDSLFLSPINNIHRIPNKSKTDEEAQKSDSSQTEKTKQVPHTTLKRTRMTPTKIKKMKTSNKSKNATGNIKNKIVKENSLKLNRVAASSIVTRKQQSMIDRINTEDVTENSSSKQKDIRSCTTLHPDRRRTFYNQSEVDLASNKHVFDLDEGSWCSDALPKHNISCWNYMPYLINSTPKKKVVILENILIKGPRTECKVNDSDLREHNNQNTQPDIELKASSKIRKNRTNNRSKLVTDLELHSMQKSMNDNDKSGSRNQKKSSGKKKNKSKEVSIIPNDESIKMKLRSANKKNKPPSENIVSSSSNISAIKRKAVSKKLNNDFFGSIENIQPTAFDKSKNITGKVNSSIDRIIQEVSTNQSHLQGDNIEMSTINPILSLVKLIYDPSLSRISKSGVLNAQETNSDATVFKKPRGKPKKAKPSNSTSSLRDEPVQNAHIDSIPKSPMKEPNNNEFIKPTRSPPKKKSATIANVSQVTSFRSTRLQELADKVNNSVSTNPPLTLTLPGKKRQGRPRILKPVEPAKGNSMQVESISTTVSDEFTGNDISNTMTISRRKKVSQKIDTALETHDNASINMEQTEEEITSRVLRPSRNRRIPHYISVFFGEPTYLQSRQQPGIQHKSESSTKVKKNKTTKKVVNRGRINLQTISEEAELQRERQNINLELESSIIDDNNLENSPKIDNVELKDSAIRINSQGSHSMASESEGTFATKNSYVFDAKENIYRNFIFDLPITTSKNRSMLTQSLPKDAGVKIKKTVIKSGCRMPKVTLKKYNLTIFVESGAGTYQLQNQTAQLTKNRFVRAYDGDEYSIANDGINDLSFISFIYPSQRK